MTAMLCGNNLIHSGLRFSMENNKPSKSDLLFLLVLALGVFARVWRYPAVPGGLNQDEAFAAYEAWALLHGGVDSSLHPWPVYLTAWGSGMNALETYLMLPLVALFGANKAVIRLPQLLIALGSLFAARSVGRRVAGERGGVCFAALVALCPWHILLSRWGLESNLAPGMLLIGLALLLRGAEDGRVLPLAALCYGLSLYAYSAIWPVMPLLLGLMLLYLRPKADGRLLLSAVILAALALPLVAFLAVNYGLIGEFSIGPFSVPRLVEMRAEEISLASVPENLKTMLRILLLQSDGLRWNSPGIYGLFYPVALPFGLLGLGELVRRFVVSLRDGRRDPAVLLLIWIFCGALLSALISVNVNRMNFLLMPLALTVALGAETLLRLFGRHGKVGAALLAALLLGFFLSFERFYYTDYADSLRGDFTVGAEEAVDAALAHPGTVYVTKALHYPKLLLFAEITPEEFNADVEYERYPAQYLSVRRFGRYVFCEDSYMPFDPDGVYLLWIGTPTERWIQQGFVLENYGVFQLLWRP